MVNQPAVEVMAGHLLRYLRTWQDDRGAIHGVHTHPVWRIHPGVVEDHYTGYATWGAAYLLALADLIDRTGDAGIWSLSERFVDYLLTTQLPEGRWDNCGMELGRSYNHAAIHNMMQDLSLSYFARAMRSRLGEARFAAIGERVQRNLSCFIQPYDKIRPAGGIISTTVNQDCAGVWAMYEWMQSFGWDVDWEAGALRALDYHLEEHRVMGVPDVESAGMLRGGTPRPDYIEPSEYYGVIIPAYQWAYRRTGDRKYADASWQMARHVMRTTWVDHNDCRRLYRNCMKINGEWRIARAPMLISGGGLFCRVLREMLKDTRDAEAEQFLVDLTRTYAFYQNPYGFVAQASGWHDDFDLIVGTTWQCHDLAFLAAEVRDAPTFLNAFNEPAPDLGVIIGWNDCWMENDQQWAIQRPWSMGFGSVGAKTAEYGYPSIPAWCGPKHPVMELSPPVELRQVDDCFVIRAPEYAHVAVLSLYGKPWEREA